MSNIRARQSSRPDVDLFVEYRRTRSRSVRNQLVERYDGVAQRCALRFAGRGEATDDLRQVALIGLIKSVERFDPSLGVAFESYAMPTIVGEIKRHFRDRTWRVSVPRRLKESRTQVFGAIDELEQRLERSPTPDEVAALLGIERELVLETLLANQVYRSSSLEASIERSGDAIESLLAQPDPPSHGSDVRLEAIEAVQCLGPRDRQIILWRYFEECTQSEIGARLGVGQVQVSRLLKAALARLREHCDVDDVRRAAPSASAEASAPSRYGAAVGGYCGNMNATPTTAIDAAVSVLDPTATDPGPEVPPPLREPRPGEPPTPIIPEPVVPQPILPDPLVPQPDPPQPESWAQAGS